MALVPSQVSCLMRSMGGFVSPAAWGQFRELGCSGRGGGQMAKGCEAVGRWPWPSCSWRRLYDKRIHACGCSGGWLCFDVGSVYGCGLDLSHNMCSSVLLCVQSLT